MDRRDFISFAGAVGSSLITGTAAAECPDRSQQQEFVGVLCDVTRCIGCRSCEIACAEAHGLPVPEPATDGALESSRETSPERWTVVNRYETDAGPVYVKKQCMHCWQPACTTACLTNAMLKTHEGPVIWREDKCMGCRYCMVSCPFGIPKFEYHATNPRIQKCIMCWDRLQRGEIPACVAACPVDALMFGGRRQLMEIARVRIYNHPDDYHHQIYGEHEVGGTGWLYLSPVPFDQLGFRTDLGTTPYPEFTKGFLYSVPVVFLLAPTLMVALERLSSRTDEVGKEHG
jgi:Fe-S-cluster-containing dehydrogenase component